jgi:hypothetical protein
MTSMTSAECFQSYGCAFIPGALEHFRVDELNAAFFHKKAAGLIEPTPTRYTDRLDFYGVDIFDQLLANAIGTVAGVVGTDLWPSYSYARIYHRGASLKPHLDRDACEITATVTISAACRDPWPICIRARSGVPLEFSADIGDMIVFCGAELEHWRNPLPNDWQLQVFLHYVRKNGAFSHLRFDGRAGIRSDLQSH